MTAAVSYVDFAIEALTVAGVFAAGQRPVRKCYQEVSISGKAPKKAIIATRASADRGIASLPMMIAGIPAILARILQHFRQSRVSH